MVERPIGRAIVIVCVLRVAFLGRRHLVLGGVLIAVADWGQFVGVGVFLIYLTWVAAAGYFVGKVHKFSHSFLGWYSKGSSGRLLGILGSFPGIWESPGSGKI